MRLIALLATHNRRARTLDCLSSYFSQRVGPGISLSAVLVDDRSVDGTAVAVRKQFPNTQVITGNGDLFWARSMAIAEEAALTHKPDLLLWLNDDVTLDQDAVQRLVDTSVSVGSGDCIVVGAVRDPVSGAVTYSGVRRSRLHPLRLTLIHPIDRPVEVDTFNGNVVLIPRAAFQRVGPIDGEFEHALADNDYGLRAAEAGVPRLLAPGTMGTCVRNREGAPWQNPALTLRERLRLLFGPKGHPPRSRARYLRRHGGSLWPFFWLAPYIRAVPSLIRPRRTVTRTPN
jgi:GT2 family glycosyltransferase